MIIQFYGYAMPADLKEKMTALRRQHILDAAVFEFEARGYEATTIRQIAQRAGVSDGTIYNVFENKEALLIAILQSLLQEPAPQAPTHHEHGATLAHMIGDRWASLTPQTLAMMRIVWSRALVDRDLGARYLDTILSPVLQQSLPVLGKTDPNIETSKSVLSGRILIAAFLGLNMLRLFGDTVIDEMSDDIPEQLAEILLNGLSPQPVSERRDDHA
jgi:AcrR family transcriptional regulator